MDVLTNTVKNRRAQASAPHTVFAELLKLFREMTLKPWPIGITRARNHAKCPAGRSFAALSLAQFAGRCSLREVVSNLAEEAFDPENFPYAFLEAFGNKAITINRLKSGSSNSSDVEGGVLPRNNIHILVCGEGEVTAAL